MEIDWTIHFGDIMTALGVVVAGLTFVAAYLYGKRKDRETANHENYQRLELASLKVFQNEMDHPELAEVWEKNRSALESGERPLYFYDAFFYQQLNLFEMACSFCLDGELSSDVFGSWVLWFANLCRSPYFREFWTQTEAAQNYIAAFRALMDEGCKLYAGETYKAGSDSQALWAKHHEFFRYVGQHMKLPDLATWLDRT